MGGLLRLLASLVLLASAFAPAGCARKALSERDARREQVRNQAQVKRMELAPVAGVFAGFLRAGESAYPASLSLAVLDVPDDAGGTIDPVPVPQLQGSLRLEFGVSSDAEWVGFRIARSGWDAARGRLDVVAINSQYKEMVLSLAREGDSLSGTWQVAEAGASGTIELKAGNLPAPSRPSGIRGDYSGLLSWPGQPLAQRAMLSLNTVQDKADSFTLSASVRLLAGAAQDAETLVYDLDLVELNPLTGRIALRGSGADVAFAGTLRDGRIESQWSTRLLGTMGAAAFSKNARPPQPAGVALFGAAAGVYYGEFSNASPQSRLPPRLVLTLVASRDAAKPGGVTFSGNVRLMYGSFGSIEYMEFPFTRVELNPFTRKFVAKTAGPSALSLDAELSAGGIRGTVSEEALGVLGTFTVGRAVPTESAAQLAGEYTGYAYWELEGGVQHASLQLVPSFDNQGLAIAGILRLGFGGAGGETVQYALDPARLNPATGAVTLKAAGGDLTVNALLEDGRISGEWFIGTRGRMGRIEVAKDGVAVPASPIVGTIRGTYQGTLRNTSARVNLPERFSLGLVSAADLTAPRGIRITASIRFYLGDFDGHEFQEVQCDSAQFDFFARSLTLRCPSPDGTFTLKSTAGLSTISGKLSHDALGEVATIEVTRK